MGVRLPREQLSPTRRGRPPGPPVATRLALGALVFLALLCNGRPIDSGDTRANERVAKSLVEELDFDLDESPEVEPPFARSVDGRRYSIYPVLPALMAAPVFALARLGFALDETGCALAGKLAASLLSAIATLLLFVAAARRWPGEGATAAWTFALGTSVWSTSQALWQHPAALVCLTWAIVWMLKAEDAGGDVWAGRAGLPLSLAVAARHADGLLVVALALGVAVRWPRRIPWLALWACPATAFVLGYQWLAFGSPLVHGFSGSLGRFSEPWGIGHLGLLVSPGKGLFVFTPVALVAVTGLVVAARRGEAWLASTLGAAALAHWLLLGRWSEWHGGESFGPRMLTDVLPLLFVFLPDGLAVFGSAGKLLLALSVGVQALGAFSYDYRWERLFQRPPSPRHEELWDPVSSPILFHARERVLLPALPAIVEGRVVIREHPMVVLGPKGSRLRFEAGGLRIQGSENNFGNVMLRRGARVEGARLRLQGRWDAVFLRVEEGARQERLELRVAGRGTGVLYVGEASFWSAAPRWSTYPIHGRFLIRHAYHYPESGGADLTVTVGKNGGDALLDSLDLVSPGDPLRPIQAP
jgi:hypothetical protein